MLINRIKQLFALKKFQYLQVNGRKLSVDPKQLVNGDELIESGTKKNGNKVYIAKLSEDVVCDMLVI